MPAPPSTTGLMGADADDVAEPATSTKPQLRLPSLPRIPREFALIGLITLGCLAFYLYHAFADQAYYRTTGYDLGIFDQAVRAYSHFKAPMVALKGSGYN